MCNTPSLLDLKLERLENKWFAAASPILSSFSPYTLPTLLYVLCTVQQCVSA